LHYKELYSLKEKYSTVFYHHIIQLEEKSYFNISKREFADSANSLFST